MENWVLLLLSFGGMLLGIVSAYFFGDVVHSYDKEKALIDMLKAKPTVKFNPWDIRCAYCNGRLLSVTDRCTHCGAPK